MSGRRGRVPAGELERAIERIRGVTAARVILDRRSDITEIHLVGSPSRQPKQIVRDTESLLYAHFGTPVDYRKISLVQLGSADKPDPRTRVRLISATAHPEAADELRVVLQGDGEHYEGTAPIESGVLSQGECALRAGSDATLAAVQRFVGPIVHLSVQEARTIPTRDGKLCLVIILASTPHGQQRLTGTCVIIDNVWEAAAKATLDAINRRLPVWIARNSREGT